jgi:hypothetical protein
MNTTFTENVVERIHGIKVAVPETNEEIVAQARQILGIALVFVIIFVVAPIVWAIVT